MRDGVGYGRLTATLTPIGMGLALVMAAGMAGGSDAARGFEWSPPLNIGAEVNSAFEDTAPHLSSDGLALYFSSNRPESHGLESLGLEAGEPPCPVGACRQPRASDQHGRQRALAGAVAQSPPAVLRHRPCRRPGRLRHLGLVAPRPVR